MIILLCIGTLQLVGQICIYYIVSNFKQHIFPLISTTRKILTVILSIFIFNHDINNYPNPEFVEEIQLNLRERPVLLVPVQE